MTEQLANRLGDILIACGAAKAEERAYLNYGLFCLISGTLQLSVLFIASLLLKISFYVLPFTIFFCLLKRTIGGWHSQKHWTCIVVYTTLCIGSCFSIRWIPIANLMPISMLFGFSMWVIVWLKAPVPHYNNPQTSQQLKRHKLIGRVVASLELLIICAISIRSPSPHLLSAAIGGCSAAVALLIPVRKEEEK